MKDSDVVLGGGGTPGSTASSLIAGVKARDPAAWQRLTRLYGPLVYGWARKAGLAPEDAADVTQDAFRAVLAGVGRFHYSQPGHSFRGWLWTVTRNKVRDHWRRHAGEPPAAGGTDAFRRLLDVAADEDSNQASGAAPPGSVLPRAVEIVRGEFEERTWQAFWRVTVDGLAPADAAAELGMTPNAVYVARSRVLRRLRDVLSEGG